MMHEPCCPIRRLHIFSALCAAALLCGCGSDAGNKAVNPNTVASGAVRHVYQTSFPASENPISEGGNWEGGSAAGNSIWLRQAFWEGLPLWGDVHTSPGLAYGVNEPTAFGDPTAIVKGVWGPEQTVRAIVRVNKTPTGRCCHEVELRLRTTISKDTITGYETYCSVMPNQPYCTIARWNGPNGSYWNMVTTDKTYAVDGDEMEATVVGTNPTIVTLYKNGRQILQAVDTGKAGGGYGAYGPFTSGNPGIGFYDSSDSEWNRFGFSSFSATDESQAQAEPVGAPK